ncbi:MAG: hypothetical protein IKN54_06310, partial [Lachnospiraceae bacterium]|nr:hypothetical protein [Lachnospiraceae bacterium]
MRINRFFCAKKALAGVLVGALLVTSTATGNSMLPTSHVVMAASEWNAGTVYNKGDEVVYNGVTYRAKWWVQGEKPDASSAWESVSGGNGNNPGDNPTTNPGDNNDNNPGDDTGNTVNPGDIQGTGTNINGVKLPANYYNRKVVGYFPNYAIGSDAHEHFNIADLQWDKLTHVQYAFAVVNKETCKIEVADPANDLENRFDDNTFIHKGKAIKMDPTLGYYGQFNIMHTLKKMYPNVTVLISTGGWGASEGLWYATQNENTMRTFASSAVAFVRQYGFDGIDIDFEFPSETPLSGNYTNFTESIRPGIAKRYAQFMKILSEEFSKAAKQDG